MIPIDPHGAEPGNVACAEWKRIKPSANALPASQFRIHTKNEIPLVYNAMKEWRKLV